jgi:hypothetical protein
LEGDSYADPKPTGEKSVPQLEVDYELLTATDGKRTVAFGGWHAGRVSSSTRRSILGFWELEALSAITCSSGFPRHSL